MKAPWLHLGGAAGRWLPGSGLALVGVLLLALLMALSPWTPGLLQAFEHQLYDQRLRALAPTVASQQIAIIDIDERSLAQHGRWPWPRSLLADLLEAAAVREGAGLIGLDLVLAEADLSSGLDTLDSLARGRLAGDADFLAALRELRPELDNDGRLADALRRLPVVHGFHLSNEPGAARIGELPTPLMPAAMLGDTGSALLDWTGHGGSLARLQQSATRDGGHLNAVIDDGGMVRRLPLLVQYQGGVQQALTLAMARAWLGGPPRTDGRPPAAALRLEPAAPPLRALHLQGTTGALRVPVDAGAMALVPYASPGSSFDRYSAADVLAGTLPAGALRGRLVLLGVSAPGLIDQRRTPVDPVMLGTLVHAHLLAGLVENRMLSSPAQAPLIDATLLLLVGGLLAWSLPRLKLWQGAVLACGLMVLLLAINLLAWQQASIVLPLALGLLLPVLMLGTHVFIAYRRATGARRALAELFGQYVPPELVAEMSRAPEKYDQAGRSAELTVLFADVSGFTTVSQQMSPRDVGAMMNLLFSHLTEVVREHRGTLDKYIGDAVMAFWGAPLDDPAHARHAVAAALAMQARLPVIQAEMAERGWPRLALNIGINTGSMVVGDMGSRHRRAYTVMGDAVNLAARLQDVCSRHQLGLLIGDATHDALGDQLCLPLGSVPIRGREGRLPIWFPLPWRAGENVEADALCQHWPQPQVVDDPAASPWPAQPALAGLRQDNWDALCRWRAAQSRAAAIGG